MRFIALLCLALLCACGGGGGDQTPVPVAIYGDSLSSGYLADTRLSPTPVERLTEYAGGAIKAVDYSVSGLTASETSIKGGEPVVLLRLGYADAILGVPEEMHRQGMERLVTQLKQDGKRVVIAGVLMAPDPYDTAAQRNDAIQRNIAQRHGLQFIDVRSLGRVTMGDPVHPDRAGSDRVSLFIAQELVRGMR